MATPTKTQTPQTNPLALPPTLSPDALDALTDLTTTLTRVRAGLISSTGAVPPESTAGDANGGTLSLKDFPGATDGVKHKVQKARVQIRQLPDMARTTEEQEKELRELEQRVKKQKEVLAKLREAGVRFGREGQMGEEKDTNQMET